MNRLYLYVTAVTKRYPDMRNYPLSSYRLLAHDIKADIDVRKASYPTDTEFLKHVESCLHGEDQMKSLRDFKRHYHAWLRRHKDVR